MYRFSGWALLASCACLVTTSVVSADEISSWEWEEVNCDAPWARRAGLQVVELDNAFYLMGGRTARPPMDPPIPGDSDIWSDVWKSTDHGANWDRILESDQSHWPARAYFRALTKGDEMFVLGGQNFLVIPNPKCPPPFEGCSPFLSVSQFFNDVWSSSDGVNWTPLTLDAGWSGRAGLSAIVFNDEIYVIGGSYLDDSAIIGGPPQRVYFNDVWKSSDGVNWTQLVDEAPFAPRAGAALAVKDGYIYLFGGEEGFLCEPFPVCDLPYFNDVWRSSNGIDWELVIETAPWQSRPGHQVLVAEDQFVLFGGFGASTNPQDPFAPGNPMDCWVSTNGADWTLLDSVPWNAVEPSEIKYDFAALVSDVETPDQGTQQAIFTFGGDRETFNFFDPFNYLNIDNDVWRFTAPINSCVGDLNGDGIVNGADITILLCAWGPVPADMEHADINEDGIVDGRDLTLLLSAWGACL